MVFLIIIHKNLAKSTWQINFTMLKTEMWSLFCLISILFFHNVIMTLEYSWRVVICVKIWLFIQCMIMARNVNKYFVANSVIKFDLLFWGLLWVGRVQPNICLLFLPHFLNENKQKLKLKNIFLASYFKKLNQFR